MNFCGKLVKLSQQENLITKKMEKIYFITVSILFVLSVLLQQKSSTLGSMMGSDGGDEMVQTRRGADKFLHRASMFFALLLLGGAGYVMFI